MSRLRSIAIRLKNKIQRISRRLYYGYIRSAIIKVDEKVECPCCGWNGEFFLPFGAKLRQNALCPRCSSLERHRLYYLYLKESLPQDKKIKLLHLSPKKIIKKLFLQYPNIDYLSADLNPRRAMRKEDFTNMSFPDNQFDFIFCAHVLEHIPDDKKAMREILRVLQPGGTAILQVPIRYKQETIESPAVSGPGDRVKLFGQSDHVRIYGKDYPERLREAGFQVQVVPFSRNLGPELKKKYVFTSENIFVCSKACLKKET